MAFARAWGALTGRVRQLGEGREREVEVAKHLPRERATPRGHGREEREGAVVPDAYPAREMRVDRAHATLKHRARKAVELEVDESLRRGRVRGKATQHVREEAQQGDAHLLRVVQMVRVPQRQDVCEPGDIWKYVCESRKGRRRREKVRQDRGPGGSSEGARGGVREDVISRMRRRRRRSGVPCREPSPPTPGLRGSASSLRIADNAEATTCGSSTSSLSRDTFARRAPRGPPARRASPLTHRARGTATPDTSARGISTRDYFGQPTTEKCHPA